ncbi:NAD(P)(+) transhydrogenase (Re/Si-specific) subunit beta [Mucilaginibacter gotjawali]|uniref:NAD(P) transhydrogenase subunit beta n=1 Tax=Mucilaginibacter gotjawali TaxID=1550579 RepID=A0A839SHK8_9SPHI|nr:NAD(P)(+) transhydrogenase (Re/Si-specific) subunit beta [Mucilaginibacter gotjawali]MBB3056783.1 NAD(P) transhydrogenase subunit beta [Mucilaginibacter gotjawali]
METYILSICYLIGSVSFILGLKMLSNPATARKGNLVSAAGMSIAIFGTLFFYQLNGEHLHNYGWIAGALVIGTVIGTLAARKVKMTAMPEMVSIFNGMGGLCAALISIVEFGHMTGEPEPLRLLVIVAGMVIGSVSFSGSMIAYGKLSGKVKDHSFSGQHIFNLAILAVIVVLGGFLNFGIGLSSLTLFYIILALALSYGVFFVLPIGGADMPVVISLLNSFTGIATAFGGFLYNNPVMLTGGILVGSAGAILTILMCKAMNRSLQNVLIGSFGSGATAVAGDKGPQGTYKEIGAADAAMVMGYAHKVIIVPGFGLAVAQAQHTCHELEKALKNNGVEVKYAIHPVAGRMPGHMNVLLAEADVSYDDLLELEPANEQFGSTDVVLILGANDVVNPAAENDPSSPIYGMPILQVTKAKMVIVNKRSMRPGYAGIENGLFFMPNTSMLFGDAKDVLQQLIAQIKEL